MPQRVGPDGRPAPRRRLLLTGRGPELPAEPVRSPSAAPREPRRAGRRRAGAASPSAGLVWIVAAAQLLVLVATSTRYGYHRDELYFIVAGSHPALGYPDQPPLVPLIARAMYDLEPGSLFPLRLPSALAAVTTTVLRRRSSRARSAAGGAPS